MALGCSSLDENRCIQYDSSTDSALSVKSLMTFASFLLASLKSCDPACAFPNQLLNESISCHIQIYTSYQLINTTIKAYE